VSDLKELREKRERPWDQDKWKGRGQAKSLAWQRRGRTCRRSRQPLKL